MRMISRKIANAIVHAIDESKYRDGIYTALCIMISLALLYTVYFNVTNGALDATKIIGIIICLILLAVFIPGSYVFLKKTISKR